MKLCIIYNFAAHYRAPIFEKLDQEYECEWYFGKANADIKRMDYSLLKGGVHELSTISCRGLVWYRGIIHLLRKKDFSNYLVFAQTKDISTWAFGLLARIIYPHKNIYFWSHGWYGKENGFERLVKKAFFRLPNKGVFLYGNYARNLMIKAGLEASKLFVVHNSLSYEKQASLRDNLTQLPIFREHFDNNCLNLLFVGRLTPIKKLDMVLKAMALLKDNGRIYNMTFVGGGSNQIELESITHQLGLSNNVWFYGPCYNENELGGIIYSADLCVSPGNVGLTAMHSMVFGTPVISHNDFAHQMPEFEAIHDGVTGCFFVKDNVSSLADSIDNWFKDNSNRREYIRRACMKEIDNNWTPEYQLNVFKKYLVLC